MKDSSIKTWSTIIATVVIVSGLIGQGCVAIDRAEATAAELTRYQEQVTDDNEKLERDIAEIRSSINSMKVNLASIDANIEWMMREQEE